MLYILLENHPLPVFKANFNSELLNEKFSIIQPVFDFKHLICGKDYASSEDTDQTVPTSKDVFIRYK